MTSVRIKSNVKAIEAKVQAEMEKRLKLVGEVVASQTRENLRQTSTRTAGPSAPGEIPHADLGMLSKSIEYNVNEAEQYVDVGTTTEYAPHLEHGTAKMAARPFMEVSAKEVEDEVQAILSAPIK